MQPFWRLFGDPISDNELAIEALRAVNPDRISSMEGRPENIPLGLIGFRLALEDATHPVRVTIHLSSAVPEYARWFTFDSVDNAWREFQNATLSSDETEIIVLHEDGGSHAPVDHTQITAFISQAAIKQNLP